MDRLVRFLLQNPILLVILLLWIAGLVGNLVKAARRARERAEQQARQRHGQLPSPEVRGTPVDVASRARTEPPPLRSADEVAREMRRILGVEPNERGDVATAPRPRSPDELTEEQERRARAERAAREHRVRAERAARAERARLERRHEPQVPQRAPAPPAPHRGLEVHVTPHVGTGLQRRPSIGSGLVVGGHELSRLGGLGAAARPALPPRQRPRRRYQLDDLTRVVVMNEILGPPLALRRGEREY